MLPCVTRFYAAGIGASEALLSYTIGGISKLGGKLSGNIISKTLNRIDNGIARFSLQYGGRILSEGLEEGIQEILEPIFKSLASNTSMEYWGGIDWENVAYSVLLGGLSSGVFELSSSITTNYNNNKLNPDEVISGMWEDSPNSSKNNKIDNVEKSQLESVENDTENGIINYNNGQQDIFDINSLPEQVHHFATNKNLKYTPQFKKIISKYGLDLNGDWNKQLMKHRGRHPYIYHDYVLYRMRICDRMANGDVDIFKNEFEKVKKKIMDNPLMLRKAFWKGKNYEILFDEI